ncbi:MAG: hypothetical protein V3V45_06850 [Candidatus Brocadiales bacterium]
MARKGILTLEAYHFVVSKGKTGHLIVSQCPDLKCTPLAFTVDASAAG